jgi:protein-tyrosine phosphatase
MTRVAATRGVKLTSLSRPLTPNDLEEFDLVLGMDAANLAAIRRAGQHWQKEGKLTAEAQSNWEKKVGLMTSYLQERGKFKSKFNEVPDPYYGGEKGFELVLDLLEDACDGLLDTLETTKK